MQHQMIAPLARLTKTATRFASENAPALLTAAAVAGVANTAFLTGKASWQASERVLAEYGDRIVTHEDPTEVACLSARETFELVWTLYIPAAISAAGTIACVIGVNTIHTRRNAALLSLYSLTDTAFKEYKDKVGEIVGPNKALAIKDEVAKDRVARNPVSSSEVLITGRGEVLCYESISGRYFHSDMETIRKGQNDINAYVINDMYASLNDFWQNIGLPPTSFGEEVGWNLDNLLELSFTAVVSDDGRPCLSINYDNSPRPRFHKLS